MRFPARAGSDSGAHDKGPPLPDPLSMGRGHRQPHLTCVRAGSGGPAPGPHVPDF